MELTKIGIKRMRRGRAGVKFKGSLLDGYRVVLWTRVGIRVLMLLAEEMLDPGLSGGDGLYDLVRSCGVDWAELIPPGSTFSIEPRLWSCTNITSTRLLWQRVKDAVRDDVSDARNERLQPPLPGSLADVPLYVAAFEDCISIYRDLSGLSLHRRGYREKMHKSALNESAAAGILTIAGWGSLCSQEGVTLVDPMCGSATFLLEAAHIAHNRAPGLSRPQDSWPLRSWPDFDASAWRLAREEAQDLATPKWNGALLGNDAHAGAIALAKQDAQAAGLPGSCLHLHHGSCESWQLPCGPPSLVVTNPPWGLRLGEMTGTAAGRPGFRSRRPGRPAEGHGRRDAESFWGAREDNDRDIQAMSASGRSDGLEDSWRALGTFLKSQCGGTDAYILSGNKQAFNHLWMKPSQKWKASIGGVDVQLHCYHVLPPKQKPAREAPLTKFG